MVKGQYLFWRTMMAGLFVLGVYGRAETVNDLGRVFTHSGSNNQNYAVVWMAPLKRYAVLAATNQGGGNEAKALDKVAATLIRKFKP